MLHYIMRYQGTFVMPALLRDVFIKVGVQEIEEYSYIIRRIGVACPMGWFFQTCHSKTWVLWNIFNG